MLCKLKCSAALHLLRISMFQCLLCQGQHLSIHLFLVGPFPFSKDNLWKSKIKGCDYKTQLLQKKKQNKNPLISCSVWGAGSYFPSVLLLCFGHTHMTGGGGLQFLSRELLRLHTRIHSGEKTHCLEFGGGGSSVWVFKASELESLQSCLSIVF